jgi:hypothetical protein
MTGAGVQAPRTQPTARPGPPRPVRLAVRLFPEPWRERYGDEFATLLEATPLTPRVAFDVLVAAVDAHLDPTGPRRRWPLMIDRTRLAELRVFAAWVLFVVAGLAFQRMIEGAPFSPIADADLAVGAPVVVLIAAAVVSLGAVVLGGVPIAAAIALGAIRSGRRGPLWLLAVPPLSLAAWIGLTVALVTAGPPPDGTARVVAFLAWVGSFVLAAIASTVAVSAAALRGQVDGSLYERAARPALWTAAAIAIGGAAVAAWGLGLLATRPEAFWGSDGLIGSSTALTWLGVLAAMAVAAGVAVQAASRATRRPEA